jgi:hypothetical protein
MSTDEESAVEIWFLEMESRRTKKMLWIHPFMNKRRGFNFLFYD